MKRIDFILTQDVIEGDVKPVYGKKEIIFAITQKTGKCGRCKMHSDGSGKYSENTTWHTIKHIKNRRNKKNKRIDRQSIRYAEFLGVAGDE